MKAKIMVILSMFLISIMVISACGPEETTEVNESEVAGPVKIGVYSVAWSPSSIDGMQELIEKFNAEHEGEIIAEYIQGDWGEADTYITSGVAGGGGIADVIEYEIQGALDWYKQGYTIDLSPYITDEVKATMPDLLWQARTTDDGAVHESCTTSGDHILIYYNPKLLEEAGITLPLKGETWTWEEFYKNIKLLTLDKQGKHLGEEGFDRENIAQWGFVPRLDQEKLYEELNVYHLQTTQKPLLQKGDDGVWDIYFEDEFLPVMNTYLNLINEGVTPIEAIGLSGSSQDELFYQGTAAIVQRGYFNAAVLMDNYPDFEFAVMPIPMQPGSSYFQTAELGQGFSVPVVSNHPAEAARFIFWMQEAENQAIWMNALMLGPCNPDAYSDPLIEGNPLFDAMRFYRDIESFSSVDINPNVEEFQTLIYGPTMMDVLMGNLSLEEGIDLIKEVSQDVLNQ